MPRLIAAATSEPIRMPTVSPAVRLAQAGPIRRGGTCSATNTHAPGTSPPTATPCRTCIASSSTLSMNIRLRPSVSP